ncbi:aromatic amino acid DMT transporter YddG [Pseudoalteromonas sp. MMG010]|uniref:aromatic amino acid DMT transporter YddG n=1 Tax=Pseudoalteromonas sp. MMG010 TaxID=2822685 RepID=UPI001B39D63C|nr:aromatic amino acid DMT transporter YddG [Pseudoalteromonas sp. MMG010]MBQ4832092.1 aromatic amino acid DMT transporter YddG [Pseudoalteromonas sp. MMG010]
MDFFSNHKYTLYGITAILLWSCLVALLRDVSELFSPIGGAALMYSVSTLFLIMVMGRPKLGGFSKRYIIWGTALFAVYEVCLALFVGLANNRHQAVEMSVINYLWPTLTILLSIIVNRSKVSVWIYPGMLLAFFGVVWCVGGDSGLSINSLANNFTSNPTAYLLALVAPFIWAVYCVITQKHSQGQNAIVLFFIATSLSLWVLYGLSDEPAMVFSLHGTITLVLAGIVVGSGYALWNQAIIGGNLMLLGTLSYFTPICSAIISALYLSISLSSAFWEGVVMVTIGSLVCYFVTRGKLVK